MIEIMTFRLVEGAQKAAFVAANAAVQAEYAPHRPGLLGRTTAQNADGDWVCIVHWRAAKDEEAANKAWGQDTVTSSFDSFIDGDSVVVKRYTPLGGHLGSM